MINLALKIATEAHIGQVDKAGVDYINHPIAVSKLCVAEDEKIVALLHDVVEDSSITLDDISNYGFCANIVEAIKLLTRDKDGDYQEYLEKIKTNPLARNVKIADLIHNSDINRLISINDEDLERIEKYKNSLEFLKL